MAVAELAPVPETGSDTPSSFDPARSEAFAERLAGALNEGALVVMTSIGHRTRLFDRMAELPAASSEEIARAAGLVERYVREWLAAMVTAGVVEYEPDTRTYRLPPEHAAFVTRRATPDNIAVTAQIVPMMGAVQDTIIERFRTGGGADYGCYPGFHDVMAEDSGQTVVAALFDHILPLVPSLVDRLETGIDVLDAGCGAGGALIEMATRFPRSRLVGYDLCEDAIARARMAAGQRGLTNLSFETRDLSGFAEPAGYDLITTFDAVHDQKDPQSLLEGIARSLRPGGVYLMQDIAGSSHLENNLDHPFGPFIYTVSCLHCMPVSLAQGGAGLGTMWGEELAEEMLGKAGFAPIDKQRLPHDPFNVYFVCRVD